jgi:hypothetical protein
LSADNPLFRELQAVHGMIRADLARVTLLAEDAAGGAAPEELRRRVAELKSSTILWQLRSGCLRHCIFVHSHHGLEDRAVFPAIRRVDPELNPVVDRLEREHREVAELLDDVERSLELIDGHPDARERLVAALAALAALLLDHLAFEEESLEPALAKMRSWVG